MSARELRAEARAWRRAAEMCAADGGLWLHDFIVANGVGAQRMNAHMRAFMRTRPALCVYDAVLACLFLALECEDEARALGRGGR